MLQSFPIVTQAFARGKMGDVDSQVHLYYKGWVPSYRRKLVLWNYAEKRLSRCGNKGGKEDTDESLLGL